MRIHRLLLPVVVIAACVSPGFAAEPPALASLGWMTGHWHEVEGEDVSDEVWMAPDGDAMIGMWRWLSGGKLRLYESLAIVQDVGQAPVLLLRHLRRDGGSREPDDEPLRLPLIRVTGDEAVFSGKGGDGARLEITYRSPSPNVLEGVVEHGDRRIEFRMSRAGAQ